VLTTLGLSPSFGFGDRLGLATAGHIAAVQGTHFVPVFAQQSVRENARTGRTPQQVMDDAKRAVETAGWEKPWGADADHLKVPDDLLPFVQAGFTFYTVDPGAYVDNSADTDSLASLQEKAGKFNWAETASIYLSESKNQLFGALDTETLLRALVKYGRAIQHTVTMYRGLRELKEDFDFEISVDETDAPTTPLEHYFIASELARQGVKFTSLAPHFLGRFEKGVDYIGSLADLDAELARHAAVTAYFGTYKISLHSGSDKFSMYPLLVKHWGQRIHVKTAGTSYLEALRTLSVYEPDLFGKIWLLGLERYGTDRVTYHVSAEPSLVQAGLAYPALLDDFHAREILHVTFGSALTRYGTAIKEALVKHAPDFHANLRRHFQNHLKLLE
jgi:hypothetical protein